MAWVEDRWHYRPGEAPDDAPHCPGACGKKRRAKKAHGQGRRWQLRYYDAFGKQRKTNFAAKGDADAAAATLTTDESKGLRHNPEAGSSTFEAFARTVIDRKAIKETSKRRYLAWLQPAFEAFGAVELRRLQHARPVEFEEVFEDLQAEPIGVQGTYDRTNEVLRVAIRREEIIRNPLALVDRPRVTPGKREAWTPGQVRTLRDHLPARYRVAVDIGACVGGQRRGEILAFSPGDVQWLTPAGRSPRVRIQRQVRETPGGLVFSAPKRGQSREARITHAMLGRLKGHMQKYSPVEVTLPWQRDATRPMPGEPADGELVTVRLFLSTPDGAPVSPSRLNDLWSHARQDAGLEQTNQAWHALRHFYASWLLMHGTAAAQVAAYMGDTVAMLHRTYHHLIETDDDAPDRRRLGALDDVLTPAEGTAAVTMLR